ncbi:hypothetical protein GT042_18525 [Streptomyces sp. SID3212]|nr:hypothetical protein [Streptomyces sp. SID3212]
MNMRRFLTAAAAGSALLAIVVPAAHAVDLGNTLDGAARAAGAVAGEEGEHRPDLGEKVNAAEGMVRGGAAVVKSANDLVN